ncbi:MAG: UPF0179 family protein [Candidatus Heimdallarchaeum aukensis]|uniref:UPF0179 protein K9W45_09695 n=1 Tax=Candidatus Heimdallarchaeum aukensis TaxID=2876573 RepID=A0A9Y1FJP0_9ARCH|nr:MAG: UPF0179 family protein [Candidatus Heimdallarchaeum aukensis]
MKITLIPKNVANLGYVFSHVGELPECAQCKLRSVCIDALVKGKNYKVVEIKKKEHVCLIDETKMVVCKVEEINPVIIIKKEKNLPVMEGLTLTIEPIECDEIFCENYEKCIRDLEQGFRKVKIKKEFKKVDCPLGYDLVEVEVEKQE